MQFCVDCKIFSKLMNYKKYSTLCNLLERSYSNNIDYINPFENQFYITIECARKIASKNYTNKIIDESILDDINNHIFNYKEFMHN